MDVVGHADVGQHLLGQLAVVGRVVELEAGRQFGVHLRQVFVARLADVEAQVVVLLLAVLLAALVRDGPLLDAQLGRADFLAIVGGVAFLDDEVEIGRASCRERV